MDESIIIQIQQGKLKGKTATDYQGGKYYSFQGIPYAKPPIGDLRFKDPLPPDNWKDVRDATSEGSDSLARDFITRTNFTGSEDCLYLNVYTPKLPNQNDHLLKAVMVFIHGGGFMMGSSKSQMYGPEYLITEDIVLVTINYRLGILGFLSLEDTTLGIPGNAGLKDMVQALKWVQENVDKFNGNPKNVSIFGESAGAAAVHFLMLSPLAKDLFHRAIMQSGSALNPWPYGTRNSLEIAKVLGYEGTNEADILQFLQSIPAEKFLEVQDKIKDSLRSDTLRPFGPVIEFPNSSAFLTKNPIDIIISGQYNKVPLLIGYNDREGILTEITALRGNGSFKTPTNLATRIPYYYNIPKDSEITKNLVNKIRKFYYKNEEPSDENVDSFLQLETDVLFWRGIFVSVRNHLKNLDHSIYLYRFTADTKLNFLKNLTNTQRLGASHGDDLFYLFKPIFLPELEPNSIEADSVQRVVKFWTNFAKYANPNPIENNPLINVIWRPVENDCFHYMDIGKKLISGIDPDINRMKFWDDISATRTINSKL